MPRFEPTTESNAAEILHGAETQAGDFATVKANLASQDQRVKRIEDDFAGVYRRLDDISVGFNRALDEQNKTAAAFAVTTAASIQAVSKEVGELATSIKSRAGTVNVGQTITIIMSLLVIIGAVSAIWISPLRMQVDEIQQARANDEAAGGTPGARVQFSGISKQQSETEKNLDKLANDMGAVTGAMTQDNVLLQGLKAQFDTINTQRLWDSQKADLQKMLDEVADRMALAKQAK
jgi:hypothetical protein